MCVVLSLKQRMVELVSQYIIIYIYMYILPRLDDK